MAFSCTVPAMAAEPTYSQETEPYYSEVVYYTGEELRTIAPLTTELPADALVAAIEKKVFVSETTDKEGNVIDSHLMTASEVEQYREKLENPSLYDSTIMGDENTSEGELTINLQLYRDENTEYRAYGNAEWTYGIYSGPGETTPDVGKDYVALTWGGDSNLVLDSKSINGQYQYNAGSISFSQAEADSYYGYCWQFNETKGSYYMDSLQAKATVSRVHNTIEGNETAMRLTYIHTYQEVTGSISFEVSAEGAAASVELSNTPKSWQIEVDIPGIVC